MLCLLYTISIAYKHIQVYNMLSKMNEYFLFWGLKGQGEEAVLAMHCYTAIAYKHIQVYTFIEDE